MLKISASELTKYSTEDLKQKVTGADGGKLLYGNDVIVNGEKNINVLYLGVLSFLVTKKMIDITTCLDSTYNRDGQAINNTSEMRKVEGTDIYVDTKNNSYTKFQKMKKCFSKLSEKERLDLYRFEIEIDDKRGNENSVREVINMEERVENIVRKAFLGNRQVIFTGAPGTGKTYSVRRYVEEAVDKDENRYKFVQFHSSYDYTDFVEGLRPVPDGNGGNMFVRMDGIFKAFCREVVKENLARLKSENPNITDIETYCEYMKKASDEEREEIYRKLDETPYYFIIDEINRADLSKVFGELMFGLEDSYREVHHRFDTQYKNLSTYHMCSKKIRVKTDEGDKEVVKEIAEEVKEDCFKKGFFVPHNLYIIGTMNDIDRSVESFDFALRRRFVWIDVKANDVMFESLKSMREDKDNANLSDEMLKKVSERIKDMNNAISNAGVGLTEAYHIGPAYFKDIVKKSDEEIEETLETVFTNRIEPILREYTRGRSFEAVKKLVDDCREKLLGKVNGTSN